MTSAFHGQHGWLCDLRKMNARSATIRRATRNTVAQCLAGDEEASLWRCATPGSSPQVSCTRPICRSHASRREQMDLDPQMLVNAEPQPCGRRGRSGPINGQQCPETKARQEAWVYRGSKQTISCREVRIAGAPKGRVEGLDSFCPRPRPEPYHCRPMLTNPDGCEATVNASLVSSYVWRVFHHDVPC